MSARTQTKIMPHEPTSSFTRVQRGLSGNNHKFSPIRGLCDVERSPLVSQPLLIQRKLAISEPDDMYEQEADRIADRVMRMPEPDIQLKPDYADGGSRCRDGGTEELEQSKPIAGQITPLIQRQTASVREGEEEQIQTKLADNIQLQRQAEKPEEEEEEPIQTKQISGKSPRISPRFKAQVHSSINGGQPMHLSERHFLESRFGYDFSQVRIHTDQNAAECASSIGARAFTVGNHIVFGAQRYRPMTAPGRRLLAHELVHVVQQTGGRAVKNATMVHHQTPRPGEKGAIAGASDHPSSDRPTVQRDLAIRPPRPEAEGRTLSPARMREAIDFNNRVLGSIPNSADVIRMIRDVLGVSPEPAVVNEDFVNAVLDWQAMYGLTQDGQLGPRTARPLFREIGAEGVGQGEVKTGPRYSPQAPTVVTSGGRKSTSFRFNAEFESNPTRGIFPSCCEVRQFISWDAAAAASFAAIRGPGLSSPHAGFPATHPANTWIEDRNSGDTLRYGHRVGYSPGPGNQYVDSSGRQNQAYGHIYHGRDFPGGPATLAGQWRFLIKVIDVSRGRRTIGSQDMIRINW